MVDKDNQAERAVLNCTTCKGAGYTLPLGVEYTEPCNACQGTGRRAPPALDAEGLPDLPEPMRKVYERPHGVQELLYYTAEQVRQAQREAVAADRQSRISADQWARLEQARLHAEVVKERRLARQDQQPARTSVDTNEFRRLLANVQHEPDCRMEPEDINLIAQINAWGGVTEDHTKQEK